MPSIRRFALLAGVLVFATGSLFAQGSPPPPVDQPQSRDAQAAREAVTISCRSGLGERNHGPADTSSGVALLRSSGQASRRRGAPSSERTASDCSTRPA